MLVNDNSEVVPDYHPVLCCGRLQKDYQWISVRERARAKEQTMRSVKANSRIYVSIAFKEQSRSAALRKPDGKGPSLYAC